MKKQVFAIAGAVLFMGSTFAYANDAAETDAVVAAVKSKNADFGAFCKTGPDNIRKSVSEATTQLAKEGKIKGNPAAIGGAAGAKIGQQCRGG